MQLAGGNNTSKMDIKCYNIYVITFISIFDALPSANCTYYNCKLITTNIFVLNEIATEPTRQGEPGGTYHHLPPPPLCPPTFLQTKVFFLVALPRFTSWNCLVWITFSSVLTITQCVHLHVAYYFKLTIFVSLSSL